MRALATSSGSMRHLVALHARRDCSRATDAPAAPLAGDGRGRLGRGQKARLGEVGGVGVAGGLPHHHPDPGAAVAPRRQLLDPAVVEHGRGGLAVLDEDLGEVSAARGGRRRAHAR